MSVALFSKKKVCFFAKVKDRDMLRRVEFYAQDIRILEDLGFEVSLATKLREIRPADFYFIWWWTWAFVPLAVAALLRRPSLITGTFEFSSFPGRPRWHQMLIKCALKRANANVFVSQLERQQIPCIL